MQMKYNLEQHIAECLSKELYILHFIHCNCSFILISQEISYETDM